MRLGDQPGYYLSARFWQDRYRELAIGDFTTRETIRARQARAALEQAVKYAGEDLPLGEVEHLVDRSAAHPAATTSSAPSSP